MPGSTPRGFPYPLGTEAADGAPQIENLARAIDTDSTTILNTAVRRFATAAARTSAIPSPVNGMVTWLDDLARLETRIAGAWTPTVPLGLSGMQVKVANVIANTNVNGVIQVPFGLTFGAAPVVVVFPGDFNGLVAAQNIALLTANLTVTDFMAGEFQKTNGIPVRIHYIAIGPKGAGALAREDEAPVPLVDFEVMADTDTPYPAPPPEVSK